MKKEVILHGECMAFPSEIPAEAQKMNVGEYVIVADSETTGNHHVVEAVAGADFYENGGTIFMENSEPTEIKCLHEDRHDSIELQPGTWEFGSQQEYDPFEKNLRAVRD